MMFYISTWVRRTTRWVCGTLAGARWTRGSLSSPRPSGPRICSSRCRARPGCPASHPRTRAATSIAGNWSRRCWWCRRPWGRTAPPCNLSAKWATRTSTPTCRIRSRGSGAPPGRRCPWRSHCGRPADSSLSSALVLFFPGVPGRQFLQPQAASNQIHFKFKPGWRLSVVPTEVSVVRI